MPIDLVIRGICCLRPGVPGMSENIHVKSIVGRFLEHARMWCFANGDELPQPGRAVYISSADWMPRNFDRRIEYMLPIDNPDGARPIARPGDGRQPARQRAELAAEPRRDLPRLQPKPDEAFNLHDYFMTNPRCPAAARR